MMLRITGGQLKGRKIQAPKGLNTRPTIERNRESVFNILRNHVNLSETVACDLFAGSGAFGIEAISRGARKAYFIDKDRRVTNLIKTNIASLRIVEQSEIATSDALKWIKKHRFNDHHYVFFIDPPYDSDLIERVIDVLAKDLTGIKSCLLVIESDKNRVLQLPATFESVSEKLYGNTRITITQYYRGVGNET